MPDSPLLQHPRHRFVAFSAVGVAMVCLPLWQVLRYQQSDLHQLAAERALLDPVAQAVHVQFGLLAHRQVAAQLLQGQAQLEPARLAVQVGVDEQLRLLAGQLAQGLWSHALAETRDLTRDWQALAHQVKTRALTAPSSDEAHALRLEQAVQVVDLVTLADVVSDAGAAARSPDSLRLAHLARHLSQWAAEKPWPGAHSAGAVDGPDTADPSHPGTPQGRLARRLRSLETALAPASNAALAEVGRTARLVLQLQAEQGGRPLSLDGPTPLQNAQVQAQQAQLALFNQALGQHKRVLAQRQQTVQRQQLAVLATWALLGAAALALAAGLLRQWRSTPQAADPRPTNFARRSAAGRTPTAQAPLGAGLQATQGVATSFSGSGVKMDTNTSGPAGEHWSAARATAPPSTTKAEASRLFSRLRTPGDAPTVHKEPGHHEPEDTLPPDRG